MPYDNLQTRDQGPPDEGAQDQRDDTFFLPADFPGADTLKVGQTVGFKVVAKNEDGTVELEIIGPSQKTAMDHFDEDMQAPPPENA